MKILLIFYHYYFHFYGYNFILLSLFKLITESGGISFNNNYNNNKTVYLKSSKFNQITLENYNELTFDYEMHFYVKLLCNTEIFNKNLLYLDLKKNHI